jgi:ferredoxin-like protein FixX
MPVTDKQYKAMESCYLSASDKLLRLQVKHERLQVENKALTSACNLAIFILNGNESVNEAIKVLENATCPLVKKMV